MGGLKQWGLSELSIRVRGPPPSRRSEPSSGARTPRASTSGSESGRYNRSGREWGSDSGSGSRSGSGSDDGGAPATNISSNPYLQEAENLFRRVSMENSADEAREILKEVCYVMSCNAHMVKHQQIPDAGADMPQQLHVTEPSQASVPCLAPVWRPQGWQ